jgi:hypothetical protein
MPSMFFTSFRAVKETFNFKNEAKLEKKNGQISISVLNQTYLLDSGLIKQ